MVKAYKKKLKRHGGAVLSLQAMEGETQIISGSADNMIRIWKLQKKKIINALDVSKPGENFLYPFMEQIGELPNFAEDHPINTVSCELSFLLSLLFRRNNWRMWLKTEKCTASVSTDSGCSVAMETASLPTDYSKTTNKQKKIVRLVFLSLVTLTESIT